MKKLGIYLMMLALAAVTFVGCEKNKDELSNPTITIERIVVDVQNLEALAFNVSVNADEALTLVKYYVLLNGVETMPKEIKEFDKGQKSWSHPFTKADFPGLEGLLELPEIPTLKFCVYAKTESTEATREADIEITNIPPPPDTPLVDGADFILIYKGSSQNDGANINTTVGLKYKTNGTQGVEGTFEVATTGGKFVELSETEANAIGTKEALSKFYSDNISKGISSFQQKPGKNINKWFISKVGDDCFLIKMNSLEFIPAANEAKFSYKY
jgi:hypothetical protein